MTVKPVILLLCFLFTCALPVQSQTAAPTSPPITTNPVTVDACGLPTSWTRLTSAATVTTFNMTADCTFSSSAVPDNDAFLLLTSGEFTINGNGYSIIGPSNAFAIFVTGSSAVLNMNSVVIRQAGTATRAPIQIQSGATFNGRGITFSGNAGYSAFVASSGASVSIENAQFLNNASPVSNGQGGSAMTVISGATVNISNSVFRGNSGQRWVIAAHGSGTILQLFDCPAFVGNLKADGSPAESYTAVAEAIVRIIGCKGKARKTPPPRPTATPRPTAMTCLNLQTASSLRIRATNGLGSGVQCQRLDGGGIGIQSIIDAGFIAAVDVWGYVEQGVEVCFPQAGRIIFLDARTIPRAMSPLESYRVNGMTCVWIESPGSLILMPAD